MTPNHFVTTARVALFCGAITAVALMLGPWPNLEQAVGLTDKEAHALAFGGLLALSFLAFPRMRRNDLAVAAILLGASVEVAQLFTPDRTASIGDLLADSIGVGVVFFASYVESVRAMARKHGSLSFREIKAMDRRKSRRRRSSAGRGATPEPTEAQGERPAGFAHRAARHFPRQAAN